MSRDQPFGNKLKVNALLCKSFLSGFVAAGYGWPGFSEFRRPTVSVPVLVLFRFG